MDQNQYDRRKTEDPFQQDLWNEYMESLEDEKQEEEQEQDQGGLSDRVEMDLDSYSRQTGSKKKAAAVILGCLGVMVLTAGVVGGIAGMFRSDDYVEDEDYVYVEPYDEYDYDDYDESEDPYMMMSRGFEKPEFIFGDHYYQLPVTFSEFDLGEYTIKKDAFSNEVTEVGAEPVTLLLEDSWGNIDTALLVASPDGSTVPLSESVIIGISSSSYDITIGNWYYHGSTFAYIEEDLEEYGYDIGYYPYSDMEEYRIVNDAPEDSGYDYYNLSFQVKDGRVMDITLLLSEEDLH